MTQQLFQDVEHVEPPGSGEVKRLTIILKEKC